MPASHAEDAAAMLRAYRVLLIKKPEYAPGELRTALRGFPSITLWHRVRFR
jgi:hypothetical protein